MRHTVWILALVCLPVISGSARGQGALIPAPAFDFYPQAPQPSAPQPSVPPEQRCVVAGRVTNALSGEPIRKATVRLSPSRATSGVVAMGDARASIAGGQGYSTSTDSDGAFRIESVNPGDYRLNASHVGFLPTAFGAKNQRRVGTIISLSPAQQKTDLSLAMNPQAVITGKVIDSDGDPVTGGMVSAVIGTWVLGKLRYMPNGSVQINDLGEYRIPNLRPGKYYLYAQVHNMMPDKEQPSGKPDMRPVRTYYPSSLAFSGATPVEVTAGQDAAGIDIRIQTVQTYHIRGRVNGLVSTKAGERTGLTLTPREDEMANFGPGQTGVRPDGTFDMAGVAPGAYYLNLFNMSGQVRSTARQAIDIGAGDVDGVVLSVAPAATIKGVARLEGTPPANTPQVSASNLHLTLMSADPVTMFTPPSNAKFSPDGTFTIDNVSPGKFYLNATTPAGTYLKSVRFGNSEVLGKELDLTGGAAGQLELTYHYGPGEIDGQLDSAQNGSGQSQTTADIAVVPDELHADGSGIRFAALDGRGSFSVANLAPGRYRVYAFEEINQNTLQNPDMLKQLESKSTLYEVKENEKKQVQLPLIHAEEMAQIYTRLGIEP